ncbi:MAG: toll/interleukin-1 receptor domain-containing protein [Lachnospiraceae bacterium]|nr:toll/interleukin-1 receptor domain-containing protein [Lachnospiraceae bacterium]
MYIFISHSSKDASTAQELCTLLETNGSTCFLAPRDIRPGCEYASELMDGIDRSDVLLLLLSRNAIASPHVLREVERAVSKSVSILVYKLENVELSKSFEYFLMPHQWLDAEHCRYDVLLNCIKELKHETTAAKTATPPATLKPNKKKITAIILGLTVIIALSLSLGAFLASFNKQETPGANTDPQLLTVTPADSTAGTDYTDTTTVPSQENIPSSSLPDDTHKNVQLGDNVLFGTYNDAAIEWKVLSISEDGTEALLVSKYILTFKAFDGADSGRYDHVPDSPDAMGNNCWETSSIRTWLNSDKDYVSYEGAAPSSRSMSDGCNAYDLEAGFLYRFTSEELAAIKETSIEIGGTTVYDKVFLLSLEDLDLFETAGVSVLSVPTAEAIARNESSFYTEYCQEVFKTDACIWWLRDPVENSATSCYQVGHGAKPEENIFTSVACADGYGIRPAITVDLNSEALQGVK